MIASLPEHPPDASGREMVSLLREVCAAHHEGRGGEEVLRRARFVAYHHASTSFGDPWWMSRVADVEEWTAAHALRRDDLRATWHAWRTGWWIRRLLREHASEEIWHHSDAVAMALRDISKRTD